MKKFVLFLSVLVILVITSITSTGILNAEKNEEITNKQDKSNKTKLRVYKVWIWQETGDCLWNIAKKYYGDPYKWRLIYEANKYIIDDPNVIYPKQLLIIPFLVDEEIAE